MTANPSWIGVSPSSVSGEGRVRIEVASGHVGKSGTLTIGGLGIPVTVGCPISPTSVSPEELNFPEEGGSEEVSVTGLSGCSWAVSADEIWITVSPSMVLGGQSVNVTVADNTVTETDGPPRTGTVTIGDLDVDVSQGPVLPVPKPLPPLNPKRDELVLDWAKRHGKANDVCEAWHSLHYSARNVFIWNTHRLNRSRLLQEVTGLYAMFGTNSRESCGGEEYNRTYMSMTTSLQDKFLAEALRSNRNPLSAWRHTQDLKGPHSPYMYSIETHDGGPRGQIHFFHRNQIRVSRSFNDNCVDAIWEIPRTSICVGVCNGPRIKQVDPAPNWKDKCDGDKYTDRLLLDPQTHTFRRGPNDEVTLGGGLEGASIFEMDQDYNQYQQFRFHDSAPVCRLPSRGGGTLVSRKDQYSRNYGDPQWDWEPSACEDAYKSGGKFAFNDDSLRSTGVRAVTLRQVRARIDGLRRRFDLTPFVWTDPTITSGETLIRGVHLTELRLALVQAYAAADRNAPSFTDDPVVVGVTQVRAVHFVELRSAVVALEE